MAERIELQYELNGETRTVTIEPDGTQFRVTIGETIYTVTAQQPKPGQLILDIDGRRLQAHVARSGTRRYVALSDQTWRLEKAQPERQHRGAVVGGLAGSGSLAATMPGLVLEVLVAEGDNVERGDTLVVLEAMKMELRIAAPHAGFVRTIHCEVGQVVERGQVLVGVEEKRE
ncbi:MAG TPA: biotin/lipoyl-containing protein [Anaerolineae bacterium]|jgi:biotin carboxyl carrier protein